MIKRIVCSLAALMVLTSSVFAWDAYSFTGVYDVSSSAPVLYASSDLLVSSSESSYDWDSFVSSLSLVDQYAYVSCSVYHEYLPPIVPGLSGIPAHYEQRPFPQSASYTPSLNSNSYGLYLGIYLSSIPFDQNGGECESLVGPYFNIDSPGTPSAMTGGWNSDYIWFNVDVSSFGEFYSFSLSGNLLLYLEYSVSSGLSSSTGGSMAVRVNGSIERTYSSVSGSVELADFIYSGSEPITSLQIGVKWSVVSVDYDSAISYYAYLHPNNDLFSLDVLVGDSVLNGFNDQAQDDINSHESIESQWTSSMSSNFDALDMDNFTFPSGLVSGFGLITGIFQDLWNSMGEYKILFVFPLTLGVALLLIGRISKFSGGQSSSRSNRGDDGA